MRTTNKDFAAFKAKLNLSPNYEKRNAASMGDVADTIDRIETSFLAFKKSNDEAAAALQGKVDTLERRLSRPGALHTSMRADTVVDPLTFEVNGEKRQALRSAEEIKSFYSKRNDGFDESGEIKMGDFMRAVGNLGAPPEVRATLSVGTDADGGYMVPSRLMGGVLSALVPASSLMSAGAAILPLYGDNEGAKSYSIAAVDTVPSAAWRLENGAVGESSPGFRAVLQAPKSLSFYFKVSREFLADAVGVDAVLTQAIAQAFAAALDVAGLRGTGVAPQPTGVLNTAGKIAVTNGANGASLATTKYANFFSATQGLLEANAEMPGAAIMSPRSRVILGGLADSTGQPLQVPDMLRGIKMLSTTQIPNNLTVGSSNDCSEIYVGDFTKLVFAMRERMSIQPMVEQFALSGQVGFICHVRADVALLYPKAFALVTGVRP
jgi:HK97 family phage major capsid protein